MTEPIGEKRWGWASRSRAGAGYPVGHVFAWPWAVWQPPRKQSFFEKLRGVQPSGHFETVEINWVVTRVDEDSGDFWALPVDESDWVPCEAPEMKADAT